MAEQRDIFGGWQRVDASPGERMIATARSLAARWTRKAEQHEQRGCETASEAARHLREHAAAIERVLARSSARAIKDDLGELSGAWQVVLPHAASAVQRHVRETCIMELVETIGNGG